LRSRFDLSIELVSALVRFNPMGKTLGVLRTRDELDRVVTVGSMTTSSQLGQLGRSVVYRADRWSTGPRAVESLLAATRAVLRGEIQRRDGPVRRFRPTAERKNGKGCLFFKCFLNSKPNLNSIQI
jgi:hypothetical protein